MRVLILLVRSASSRCARNPYRLLATSAASPSESPKITSAELTQANSLLPRLCAHNRLPEAIRLIDACVRAGALLRSLSLHALVSRLASNPGSSLHAASLLDALSRNPRASPSTISTVSSTLLSAYYKNRRPEEALAVFQWMCGSVSASEVHPEACRIVVIGLCKFGRTVEALAVVRDVMGGRNSVAVGTRVRASVYKSLLRGARVREAQEVEMALGKIADGGDVAAAEAAVLLDRIISEWTD